MTAPRLLLTFALCLLAPVLPRAEPASRTGGSLLEQWMDARALEYPAIEKKPNKELQAVCQ